MSGCVCTNCGAPAAVGINDRYLCRRCFDAFTRELEQQQKADVAEEAAATHYLFGGRLHGNLDFVAGSLWILGSKWLRDVALPHVDIDRLRIDWKGLYASRTWTHEERCFLDVALHLHLLAHEDEKALVSTRLDEWMFTLPPRMFMRAVEAMGMRRGMVASAEWPRWQQLATGTD